MRSASIIRVVFYLAILAYIVPAKIAAQDDPNDVPLGDVARQMRKKTPSNAKPVIDDDNLPQVMEQANRPHEFGSGLRFLMSGEIQGFQVQTPDVTCSLSFTANVKTLLSPQYNQMDLPASELPKIDAKAVIEGDALTVPLFNGTQWHLSELVVAITVLKRAGSVIGTLGASADPFEQVRPEKKPDQTLVYRMRAAGGPWQRSVFSAPLNLDLGPDDEWHWAIVQAKGYPPDIPSEKSLDAHASKQPQTQILPVSLDVPQTDGAASVLKTPE
jgi:hypothetical protein